MRRFSLRRRACASAAFGCPSWPRRSPRRPLSCCWSAKTGLGPWQVIEYYEALDRRVKQPDFPVVLVLLEGQPAPGLPFLRQLHWIITADPASEKSVAQFMDAAGWRRRAAGELWRHTAPYRGLAAMTEADSDFFFGRGRETVEVIRALEATPDKLAGPSRQFRRWQVLAGASGRARRVYAAGLARNGRGARRLAAGVQRQPALVRAHAQARHRAGAGAGRAVLSNLAVRSPPIRARATLQTRLDRRSSRRTRYAARSARRHRRRLATNCDQSKPPAFLLYIDQGEELYVRAEQRQRRRFSESLAEGLADPRLRALMSLRADFFGELQNDEPLYAVAPADQRAAAARGAIARGREPAGRSCLAPASRPIILPATSPGGRRRNPPRTPARCRCCPISSTTCGRQMVQRGDGVLRLPAQAIELGGVLVDRANAFLPASERRGHASPHLHLEACHRARGRRADAAARLSFGIFR